MVGSMVGSQVAMHPEEAAALLGKLKDTERKIFPPGWVKLRNQRHREELLQITPKTILVGGLVAYFFFPYIGNNHPN